MRSINSRQLRRAILSAVIAFLAAYGITLGVSSEPQTVTRSLGGPGPTSVVKTTTGALDAVETSKVGQHSDARDETPTGVTGAQIAKADKQQRQLAATNPVPDLSPAAAPEQRGCRSNFVRNYSSRRGVRPIVIVVHYTVSSNLPGFRDINALTAYANSPSSGVSWHFNVDRDGNCAYTVRETDKAWTQATFNPVSIGIEFVSTGRPGDWLTARGRQRAARLLTAIGRRWDIPLRRGAARGCVITRTGIVQHADLGACGGGHSDIVPFSTGRLILDARAHRRVTSTTTRRCNELAAIRRSIRAHTSTPAQRDRARALKGALGQRATTCR